MTRLLKNLDALKQQKADIVNKMNQAVKDGNEEAFAESFMAYTDMIQDAVLAEAKGLVNAADNQILAGRGARTLTSEERNYYQKVIDAMKSGNPQQALSGFGEVLPKTVIDAIFEDITEEHPLLGEIKFENTAALIEYLYSTMDGRFLATWGQLCSKITKEISAQFHKLNLGQTKLSAFLPLCKAMLDLGPTWVDRYVRAILAEAIANGLEDGIINGRGVAEGAADPDDRIYEPIGMIKDLTNFDLTTGYADKAAQPVIDFSPGTYGGLIAQLAVGPNLLHRTVREVLLVVNPVDYLTKIMPATTYQKPDGTYANNIFPFPTKVVQSAYMPQGKAVIGIGKRYLMAMGAGTNGGKIEHSDEYKFLEDERYYLIKLYGTGRPIDNTSFLLLDISKLKPSYPIVRVADYVDAKLSDIKLTEDATTEVVDLGDFDENIHYYVGEVEDVSEGGDNEDVTLEVTTNDERAVVSVECNASPVVESDGSFEMTLGPGQNVIVIKVALDGATETYVLVITYTPIT